MSDENTMIVKVSGHAVYIAVKHYFAEKGEALLLQAIERVITGQAEYLVRNKIKEIIENRAIEDNAKAIIETLPKNFFINQVIKKEVINQIDKRRLNDLELTPEMKKLIREEVKSALRGMVR